MSFIGNRDSSPPQHPPVLPFPPARANTTIAVPTEATSQVRVGPPALENPPQKDLIARVSRKTASFLAGWNRNSRTDAQRDVQNQDGVLGLFTRELREKDLYAQLVANGDVSDSDDNYNEDDDAKLETVPHPHSNDEKEEKQSEDNNDDSSRPPPKKKRRVSVNFGQRLGRQKWCKIEQEACEIGMQLIRVSERYEQMKRTKSGITKELAQMVHHWMYADSRSPLYLLEKDQQRSVKQIQNKLNKGTPADKEHGSSLFALIADLHADLKGPPEGVDTDQEAIQVAVAAPQVDDTFVSKKAYREKKQKQKQEAANEVSSLSIAVQSLVELEIHRARQQTPQVQSAPADKEMRRQSS